MTLVHAVIVSLLIYIAAVLTISNLTISAKVPLCSEKAKDSSSAKSSKKYSTPDVNYDTCD